MGRGRKWVIVNRLEQERPDRKSPCRQFDKVPDAIITFEIISNSQKLASFHPINFRPCFYVCVGILQLQTSTYSLAKITIICGSYIPELSVG